RLAYGLVALAALTLRMVGLGWWPFGPAEAWQALPALAAGRGQPYDLTDLSPLLFTLQRLIFALFGADEASARIGAALLGGLSVLCFYALRDRLTRGGALAAAVLWAASPMAVFTARQGVGDGLVPSLALALLAAVNLAVRSLRPRPNRLAADAASRVAIWPAIAAGVAGLLLTTGPAAYTVVAVGIAAAVCWRTDLADLWARLRGARRATAIAFILAFAFGATCFFLSPDGLAAAADLLGGWLVGLVPAAGEYGAWDIVRRLLISEPPAFGFGVAGLVVALRRGERFGRFVGMATGIAWLAAVVGRGRHPLALGLVVLGLVILAGPAVAAALRHLPRWRGQADPWLLVALELVLIATAGQCVPAALNPTNRADWVQLYTALGIITFTMALLLWLIYGAFGSWRIVAEALPVVLLIVGLAWGVNQLSGINYDRGAERRSGVLILIPDSGGLADLHGALRDLAALKGTGAREARLDLMLPESMARTVAPILRWELRALPNLRVVNAFPADRAPLAITAADATAAPGPTYSGAEFAVLRWWRPDALQGVDAWVRWLIYREVPATARASDPAAGVVQKVVLWVDRAAGR
ncbi:MAG: glycosyltransferase family 39 protein, partial [Anaerolineae bacterium]